MMKWLLMIMSFVMTRMSVKQQAGSFAWDMYEEIVFKSRQVTMLALVGFAAATLFCAGLLISLLNVTSQYDLNGFITFTATLGMGLGLLAIAGAGFSYIFMSAWPGVRNHKLAAKQQRMRDQKQERPQEPQHLGSALEQAVSLWIVDVVKDREIRRSERAAQQAQTEATSTGPSKTEPRARPNMDSMESRSPIH